MKIKIHFVVVILCVISSQVFTQDFMKFKIEDNYDEFDGNRYISMTGNYLETKDWKKLLIDISGAKSIHKDSTISYYINVYYRAKDWLFISDGESLIFLIDGERVGLSGDGSQGHRNASRYSINEGATYIVEKMLLKKIADAKEIKIKIVGKGYHTDKFSHQNIANFKQFVDKFID